MNRLKCGECGSKKPEFFVSLTEDGECPSGLEVQPSLIVIPIQRDQIDADELPACRACVSKLVERYLNDPEDGIYS